MPAYLAKPPGGPLQPGEWTRGLVLACSFGEQGGPVRCDATGRTGTLTGGAWGYGSRGEVRQHTATSDRVNFGESGFLPTTAATVVVVLRQRDATHRNSSCFGVVAPDLTTKLFGAHCPYGDGVVYWDFGGNSSGSTRLSVSGLTFDDDVFVFSTGARGMEIWQNGIRRASNGASPTRVATSVYDFRLGEHNTVALSDLVDYGCLLIYDRQLSEPAIRELSVDPFLPWRPPDPLATYAAIVAATATGDAVGSASGSATVAAVGASTFAAAGSSSGSGAASAVGASTAAATASSAGVSAASGVGASVHDAAATAAGVATAEGLSPSIVDAAGSSSGTGTATAVGSAIAAATASAAGVGAASGAGAALADAAGSAAGVGAASAAGASIFAAAGTAAGTATAGAVGASIAAAIASATGTATASAASDAATPAADLVAAVVAALKAADLADDLPGGVWDEDGPRGKGTAYAVVTEISDVPEWELGAEDGVSTSVDRQAFQVAVFAARRDSARSLGRRAAAVLGAAELAHDDGTQVACWHTGTFSAREPERGLVGQDLYMCVVTFDALIERET